jgi:hypothetical protein
MDIKRKSHHPAARSELTLSAFQLGFYNSSTTTVGKEVQGYQFRAL